MEKKERTDQSASFLTGESTLQLDRNRWIECVCVFAFLGKTGIFGCLKGVIEALQ